MTNHFNNLTEAEQERLTILIEECSEVIHIGCKILRHGYESYDPTDLSSKVLKNRSLIEVELAHLGVIIGHMISQNDIDKYNIDKFTQKRVQSDYRKYHHHQKD